MNKSLNQYLITFTSDKPIIWVEWLSLCEFWFNTNYQTSTKFTPFEALYGIPPPKLLDYIPGITKVKAVDRQLRSRQQLLAILKHNLVQAQNSMKLQADQHQSNMVFEVGNWVYLRLQPYKQQSIAHKASHKLSPRYFGPFQVIQKIGATAFRLELPPKSKIHPVFHVSCLKKQLGHHVLPIPTLPCD